MDLIILTLGFDKPQKKIQNRMLKKAGELRKEYLAAKARGDFSVVYHEKKGPLLKGI